MILETSNPEFDTIIETLIPKYDKVKVTVIYENGDVDIRRLGRAFDHAIMIYHKGSKRYGYYLVKSNYVSIIFPEKKAVAKDYKWVKSWTNVLDRLNKSGLWAEYVANVKIALDIGVDKIKQAYNIEAEFDNSLTYDESKRQKIIKIQDIDPRLVKAREDGSLYPNTEILWYMHNPARIKKMYFGKYINEDRLDAIKKAMDCKVNFSTWGRANYDVHFEYHPEGKKAFYNEEYKNKGNGHYYLALDATHALYYEDD